ncbi:MAG: type II secretion system protein [Candidatus Latescibacteria bacterium]|nr:type II secretion system protein [Candidatus Latescibacterota bacterium]
MRARRGDAQRPRPAGFSLIELMVVIVVIGVLAALAIPRFTGVSNKAKSVEAHTNLKFLYDLELDHYQLHDRYLAVDEGQDSPELGFRAPKPQDGARYTYRVAVTQTGFMATATERVDINQDGLGQGLYAVYSIDQGGQKTGNPSW